MDTLPPEILQRIFEFACTDGGHTGHSLSLVSKAIRETARTTRFHSVALAASPRRLQTFVRLYARERECDPARGGYKPRIQHLHVAFPHILPRASAAPRRRSLSPPLQRSASTTPPPVDYSDVDSDGSEDPDPAGRTAGGPVCAPTIAHTPAPQAALKRDVRPLPVPPPLASNPTSHAAPNPSSNANASDLRREVIQRLNRTRPVYSVAAGEPDPTASPEYLSAAQTLFRLVAPDLVTLVVQCGFTSGGALHLPIMDRPFPRLLEATFVGVEDPRTVFSDSAYSSPPLFPTMTHLYVVPTWRRELSLPMWAAHAPRVTHLGVSRADDFVDEIARAIGVRVELGRSPWDDDSDDDSEPGSPSAIDSGLPLVPTYPSVRHLLLQPGPGPIGAKCGNMWMYHYHGMRRLRQFAGSCKAVGVEAVVVAAPTVGESGFYYERARRGWLERIGDGDDGAGCWADMVVSLEAALGPSSQSRAVDSGELFFDKLREVVDSLSPASGS
ncbi:hypothetical protein TRAPUB_3607 [Trametes pubescens]|uniref:Uncharacterized protein n=1 Tax=Trametes pubescens TaxID=154538 RepID=A0A1M2VDD8_TRAPU|nr:hypothetical protein TRAPUB_3607 [Trametes pubescens]